MSNRNIYFIVVVSLMVLIVSSCHVEYHERCNAIYIDAEGDTIAVSYWDAQDKAKHTLTSMVAKANAFGVYPTIMTERYIDTIGIRENPLYQITLKRVGGAKPYYVYCSSSITINDTFYKSWETAPYSDTQIRDSLLAQCPKNIINSIGRRFLL